MQDRLIQRYLGNKSPIAPSIVSEIKKLAVPGDLIFDAFSGTLSVSASLREAGFCVASNDINHFSWTYAIAYFSSSELPWPDGKFRTSRANKTIAWKQITGELIAPYPKKFPRGARRTDIFDHYCEEGKKSSFTSSRGRSGRRRFFSAHNAILIDRALSRLRHWHREEGLSEQTRCLLMATLLSAVEKVSNTQGTYHDFPREIIDPRALQPLSLKPPDSSLFIAPRSQYIGKAQDTLEFVREVPNHRVIYIDPPYNFRQYTSYYFMLNLLSQYPEIQDINEYFSHIEFVRGQNMSSDFKSSFSSKQTFISSLAQLIKTANAEYVMLSYFDGRNHWGSFKSNSLEKTGGAKIRELFCSKLFVDGSLKCTPIQRLNYQSYGGYSARKVNELLFVAKKRTYTKSVPRTRNISWNGRDIGMLAVS